MAAARYWRLVGVSCGPAGLALSELQLYGAAGRVDAGATLTCSHAPVAGALVNLQDGDTGTTCEFAAADVAAPGFWLGWDLGAAHDADGLRPGSGTNSAAYLLGATLQRLDAGAWVTVTTLGQFVWPGPSAMDVAPSGEIAFSDVTLLLNVEGVDGSTTITDSSLSAHVPTSTGGAALSTTHSAIPGASSLKFSGSGPQVQYAASSSWRPSLGEALTIEVFFVLPSVAGNSILVSTYKEPEKGFVLYTTGTDLRANLSGDVVDISGGVLVAGQLHHAALSGVPGAFKLFLDGVQAGSTFTGAVDFDSDQPLSLGGLIFRGAWYDITAGYFHGVRISKGLRARYTENFTPPSIPFATSSGPSQVFDGFATATRNDRATVCASAYLPAHAARTVHGLSLARDVQHGGTGTIYGTTKTKGTPNTPTKARVVLLAQRGKTLVRETWSDPATGAFEFRGIDTAQNFLTLAEDAGGNFRPVAASMLVPELLP